MSSTGVIPPNMLRTYRNSYRYTLSAYERTRYRTRMLRDLARMFGGMGLVVFGVQLIGVPAIGMLLAAFLAGTGAYLFISGFCRRIEDFFEKYDLTHAQ